jgi:lipopolysaccharide export system protein LptA
VSFAGNEVVMKLIVRLAIGSVLALAFGTSSVTKAEPLAVLGGETLDVSAQRLDVEFSKSQAVLEGQVKIILGGFEAQCDRVDIRYDETPHVKWARGSGNVRLSVKGIVATAELIEVDVSNKRAQLLGNVRLTRGRGWVAAEKAVIELATNRVSLEEVKGSIPVAPPAR